MTLRVGLLIAGMWMLSIENRYKRERGVTAAAAHHNVMPRPKALTGRAGLSCLQAGVAAEPFWAAGTSAAPTASTLIALVRSRRDVRGMAPSCRGRDDPL